MTLDTIMVDLTKGSIMDMPPFFTLKGLLYCAVLPICYAICYTVYYSRKPKSKLPWVAYDDEGLRNVETARKQWIEHCTEIVDKGLRDVSEDRNTFAVLVQSRLTKFHRLRAHSKYRPIWAQGLSSPTPLRMS